MNVTIRASAISAPAAGLLEDRPFAGQVLSVHRRACNLVDSHGQLLALVGETAGNGPFHLVVPQGEAAFSRLAVGCPAWGGRGSLRIGGWLTVDWREAELWNPRPDWDRVSLARQDWSACLSPLSELVRGKAAPESLALIPLPPGTPPAAGSSRLGAAWRARAGEGMGRVIGALQGGDLEALRLGVEALAGLGPGLTPAGDDFLLGVLVGVFATAVTAPAASPSLPVAEAGATILETAAGRTNLLSAAWLQYAAHGLIGQSWHRLLYALSDCDSPSIRRAADRLLAVGATSGADALTGFLLYCQSRRSVLYYL